MWELCLYIRVQVVFLSVCKVQYFNEYCTVRAIRRLEWVCMIPAPYSFCTRQRSESDVLSVVLRSNSWIQTQIFQSDCINLIVIRTKTKKKIRWIYLLCSIRLIYWTPPLSLEIITCKLVLLFHFSLGSNILCIP